jgi:hypothetical protein
MILRHSVEGIRVEGTFLLTEYELQLRTCDFEICPDPE